MPDNAAPMQKAIDLDFKINDEGLTGKDLLQTFMAEFQKRGLYVAGVIVTNEPGYGIQIFGHQGKGQDSWAVKAMEHAVFRYKNATLLHEERLSTQTN